MNKIIKNILIILILLGLLYTVKDKFKIFFNTSFNKYSNILENRIYEIHDLINNNNILYDTFYSGNLYNINKTFIILIVSIFTSIIFFYIYLFNKSIFSSTFIILYIILILVLLKLLI